MKIFRWIDQFVDTFQKRILLLGIIVLGYWIWQNIWQGVFMFDLSKVNSYDELFAFYSHLDAYDNSFVIRIVLSMISMNGISFYSIVLSILSCVRLFDYFFIIFTVLLFIKSEHKRKWIFFPILYFIMFIFIGCCIVIGINSESIGYLISVLKVLSMGSLIIEFILFICLLYMSVDHGKQFIDELV